MSTTTIQALFQGSANGHDERPNNETEGAWFHFQPKISSIAAFSNAIIIMQTMHIILNALHIKRIDIILGPHCCPQYTNVYTLAALER
jgi:hypothetical protein